jgi:hypothetical protein
VGFSGSPTASQTYNFDRTALAGTYTICTTSGNCLGGSSGGANAALSASRRIELGRRGLASSAVSYGLLCDRTPGSSARDGIDERSIHQFR